jgi:hypothetical protein
VLLIVLYGVIINDCIGCSFNILVALPMEIFCFSEGMSSFELPVSKIIVELSILTFAFKQVYCLVLFTLEQKTFLIESYFRNGLKVNGSWIYSVQNCLEEFIAEFPNVIVDGVKLFRETGRLEAFTEEKPQVSR